VLLVQIEQDDHSVEAQSQEAQDGVLRLTSGILNAVIREMDLIGRYERACFSVLLPRTTLQEGVIVAERIRHSVDLSDSLMNCSPVQIALSVGVAEVSEGDDVVRLLQRAEAAMSVAEKSRTCCHNGQWPEVIERDAESQASDPFTEPVPAEVVDAVSAK